MSSGAAINPRIVGGTNSTKYQFPYYVQIVSTMRLNETSNGHGNCGGSLISSTHILTAAHCVDRALLVRIVVGFYSVDDRKDARLYQVKSVAVHENYNQTFMSNDIAIVEVTKEIEFNDAIKPISFSCNYTLPAMNVTIAGTGITSDVEKQSSNTLQWVNLKTIPNEQCARVYGRVETSNVCAVTKPKYGPCHGDSGSALIRQDDGNQMQVGIASYGAYYRCERGHPTVSTRISDYLDWIKLHSNVSCVNE